MRSGKGININDRVHCASNGRQTDRETAPFIFWPYVQREVCIDSPLDHSEFRQWKGVISHSLVYGLARATFQFALFSIHFVSTVISTVRSLHSSYALTKLFLHTHCTFLHIHFYRSVTLLLLCAVNLDVVAWPPGGTMQ